MEYLVIAEIEIDGNKIEHYTNITLRQKFNEHHQFTIRISHDVLETSGSFSLENAQKKIGKSTLIRFQKLELNLEVAYEFRGIICEVRMEQNGKSDADLLLIGFSPTIVLENGQHLTSFYKNDLQKIVQQVTKPLDNVNCKVNINNQYSKDITYICQYRESSFHFLNRLSGEFSEFFYYDGKYLNFGKPSSVNAIDITYGEDLSSMQMTLQAQPMNFSNYAYISKEDKVEKYDAPGNVNGMGQYASYVLKESNNLFSEQVNAPIRQRVENKSDLENFVKKQKAALAANLEVLTGTCNNPAVTIGSQINVKVSKLEEASFVKEDYGKFLVIGIEHHLNANGKYYNTFEAIPASTEVLPVPNIIVPVAEPQIAIVKDNNDPDTMGRVRVQMLWQKGNEMTDWIRVMTPDAGGGQGGARNRGLVVIPEVGDQVLICFHYNDADKPFVMGSLFHGHSGGGGGGNNINKTLIALSGALLGMFGMAVHMIDAVGNFIKIDGSGNINLESTATICLKVGTSEIKIEPSKITIKAIDVKVDSTTADIQGSSKAVLKKDDSTYFKAEGAAAEVKSANTLVEGTASSKLKGAMVEVNATGITDIKGSVVKLNG
jgi:type VI secretion system secreted protein VgrG